LLTHKRFAFAEEELQITTEDLQYLGVHSKEHFDGFGLLHAGYFISKLADRRRCYSFIHRAVPELLAAISVLHSDSVESTIDLYFHEGSSLSNMFPFLFGLMPKMQLRSLATKLKQKYMESGYSNNLLVTLLHCFFEAQDEMLCREFGQIFGREKEVNLILQSHLEYQYAAYFLSSCCGGKLSINFNGSLRLTDTLAEELVKYLCNTSTEIVSFGFLLVSLSLRGVRALAQLLSCQHNLLSLNFYIGHLYTPGSVSVLCDSVCRYNTQVLKLRLPHAVLNEEDLDSLASLIVTSKYLQDLYLYLCSSVEGAALKSSQSFTKALCRTLSLKKLSLGKWSHLLVNIETVLSQNFSLLELHLNVATTKPVDPILNILSTNTKLILLRLWPNSSDASTIGQCLENFLSLNQSLTIVDFTSSGYDIVINHILWSSVQVTFACTGLQSNSTIVTLDISGCNIDKTAGDSVCAMLSLNTSLRHLFLNPVHMEKSLAAAVMESCNKNTTLQLLSLVHWPDKVIFEASKFSYSDDEGIASVLEQVRKSRQDNSHPALNIIW